MSENKGEKPNPGGTPPPSGKAPAPSEGADGQGPVPYTRFKEVNEEKNSLKAKAEKLERELASLRNAGKNGERDKALAERLQSEGIVKADGEGADEDALRTARAARVATEETLDNPEIRDALAEVKRARVERKLRKELKDVQLSDAQLESVIDVQSGIEGLSTEEALVLAQTRNPSLFPQDDGRGFDERSHYQTGGRSSGARNAVPAERDIDKTIKDLERQIQDPKTTPSDRSRAARELSQAKLSRTRVVQARRGA